MNISLKTLPFFLLKALYLDKMVWKEMYDFSSDSRLVVFSDCLYDKNEYISNYDDFLKEVTCG